MGRLRVARNQAVAPVMGVIVVWLGSLVAVLVMDVAVNTRLAVHAVRRYERRSMEELAARSAAEYAAMLLQGDPDRSSDTPRDLWATAVLPDSGGYLAVWPDGAAVTITDLERTPLSVKHLRNDGTEVAGRTVTMPRWLNVCTAPAESWEAMGISLRGAQGLVRLANQGLRDVRMVTTAEGLSSRDLQVLAMLLDRGLLATRSEFFHVAYHDDHGWSPEGAAASVRAWPSHGQTPRSACYAITLRREPARGVVSLLRMERTPCGP